MTVLTGFTVPIYIFNVYYTLQIFLHFLNGCSTLMILLLLLFFFWKELLLMVVSYTCSIQGLLFYFVSMLTKLTYLHCSDRNITEFHVFWESYPTKLLHSVIFFFFLLVCFNGHERIIVIAALPSVIYFSDSVFCNSVICNSSSVQRGCSYTCFSRDSELNPKPLFF